MDVSTANLGSHCERVVHIARLDIARQAVRRVVSNLDRFVFVLIRKNREDRPEDFLARDGHVVIHVTEDGGLDVVASVQAIRTPCAAADQFSAFIDALLDQALNLVPLNFADNRTNGGSLTKRVARFHVFGSGFSNGKRFIVLRSRHQHSGRRITALAGVGEHLAHTAANGCRQISILKDNVCGLAAQFLSHSLH